MLVTKMKLGVETQLLLFLLFVLCRYLVDRVCVCVCE